MSNFDNVTKENIKERKSILARNWRIRRWKNKFIIKFC